MGRKNSTGANEPGRFERVAKVSRVDKKLGIVFGWAVESMRKGEMHFDTQGDHYTEDAMVADFADFMLKSRTSGEMHEVADGDVVFLFPLTSELAKAMEIKTERTGVMVGIKPSPEVLAKFESGEYTGFSIGGQRLEEEVVQW